MGIDCAASSYSKKIPSCTSFRIIYLFLLFWITGWYPPVRAYPPKRFVNIIPGSKFNLVLIKIERVELKFAYRTRANKISKMAVNHVIQTGGRSIIETPVVVAVVENGLAEAGGTALVVGIVLSGHLQQYLVRQWLLRLGTTTPPRTNSALAISELKISELEILEVATSEDVISEVVSAPLQQSRWELHLMKVLPPRLVSRIGIQSDENERAGMGMATATTTGASKGVDSKGATESSCNKGGISLESPFQ
ncbi:hypothetical protein M9H77_12006 [Catharanthus roseus]|uniref:Uncharacterized protein n=1 Tax=Catharanthus roseus TaxID=4058 RepID=A0ACC0BG89_CATRO|nr:hypothetical protein M9H77_12006 [Catharanthus roseus]